MTSVERIDFSKGDLDIMQTLTFTVDDMVNLLTAYDAYHNLLNSIEEIQGIFPGLDLSCNALDDLTYISAVLDSVSPLYHDEDWTDDEDDKCEYQQILEDRKGDKEERALKLMGG